MEDKKSDWTIGELYSKAFEIVKKNKVLWIFGMAMAVGGGSFNFRLPSSLDNFSRSLDKHPNLPEQSSSLFSQVLGTATSAPFTENIGRIFQSVPSYLYLALGLSFFCVVIIGVIITIFSQAWSSAAMIQSSQIAIHHQKVTIEQSSEKALSRLKSVLWLNIIPGLIFSLVILAAVILIAITFATGSNLLGGILTVLAIVLAVAAGLMLTATTIWALREAVLHDKSGKQSLQIGFKLARRKFWSMMLLGLVNNIFAAIVILVPILIIGVLVFSGFYAKDFASIFGPILVFFGGLFGLIFFLGFILIIGIINAFKTVVWNLAFQQIRGNHES